MIAVVVSNYTGVCRDVISIHIIEIRVSLNDAGPICITVVCIGRASAASHRETYSNNRTNQNSYSLHSFSPAGPNGKPLHRDSASIHLQNKRRLRHSWL